MTASQIRRNISATAGSVIVPTGACRLATGILLRMRSVIDDYIRGCDPEIQPRLRAILAVARRAAPDAEEIISYKMPALRHHRNIFYFAAFKKHIGVFPPVRGPEAMVRALKRYMGPKGNLQFPNDAPIPISTLEKLIRLRVAEEDKRALSKKAAPKRRASK